MAKGINTDFMTKVEFWDDERRFGNGIIVTLKAGWVFEEDPDTGVRGFDTVKAAAASCRRAIRRP